MNLPIDLMAGERDPGNHCLPQQPLLKPFFPRTGRHLNSFNTVCNPHAFEVDGVTMLGSSGQNLDDMYKFVESESRLDLMAKMLNARHIAPTAPDTLGCYPFFERDPFILEELPRLFFCGNQPRFETKVLGTSETSVRLIAVPSFAKTHTAVLVNLRTLDCRPCYFSLETSK